MLTPVKTMRRLLRMVAVLVVVVGLIGGCVVEVGSSVPEAKRRVVAEGRVEYDLRGGMTREEVGFTPGRSIMAIQVRGEDTIDVTVILPDGRRFEFAAMGIHFAALNSGDEDIDPYALDLDRRYPTVDEAYAVLVAFDEQFGLDTSQRSLDQWRDASLRKIEAWRDNGGPLMQDPMVWQSLSSGEEVLIAVETRYGSSSGEVWLRFMIDWSPSPVLQSWIERNRNEPLAEVEHGQP